MTNYLDEFTTYLQKLDRSPLTVKGYRHDVEIFFAWLEERLERFIPLIEVTPFDLQKYRNSLEGSKPSIINRRLAGLRAFFAWAKKQGVISSNPVDDIKGIKQDDKSPQALSRQEIYKVQREAAARRQLAQAKAGPDISAALVDAVRDEAILNLLLYTGLRVAEAAALKLGDVEINNRKAQVTVTKGKGRKYREIPLHPTARKTMEAYLKVRPRDRGDVLFLGQRGPLGIRGIQFRIQSLAETTEVDLTCHVLRHTCATRMLREAKADLVTVARVMGHSNINTTMIYTQPSHEDKVRAVEGVE